MCGTGGGGVGSYPTGRQVDRLEEEIRREDDAAQFRNEVNDFLQEVLIEANQRDAGLLQRHLEEIREAVEDLLEDTVDLRFGGSVSKHTYVDSLSDVDLLALVKRDIAADASPKDLIREFGQAIKDRLSDCDVKTGELSIKIVTPDGTEIQVLPAYRTADGYRIARPNGETWSDVIRPREFARQLTAVNQANNNKVVPAIKLYKIAQQRIPERGRIHSYHIEALAVEAFRNYDGPYDRQSMFLRLAKYASARVMQPMGETTGQAAYLDRHLGPTGSDDRARIAKFADRLATRLERASRGNDVDTWREAFDIGEP